MNEPLALEQLRVMVNKPVWVEFVNDPERNHWEIVKFYDDPRIIGFIDGSYCDAREYGISWLAYAYPPAHINREEWEHCDECKPSCKICANYNAWDRYGKPQVCDTCEDYSNFEPDCNYCDNCGRPMTEKAWNMIERRLRYGETRFVKGIEFPKLEYPHMEKQKQNYTKDGSR